MNIENIQEEQKMLIFKNKLDLHNTFTLDTGQGTAPIRATAGAGHGRDLCSWCTVAHPVPLRSARISLIYLIWTFYLVLLCGPFHLFL